MTRAYVSETAALIVWNDVTNVITRKFAVPVVTPDTADETDNSCCTPTVHEVVYVKIPHTRTGI